MRHWIATSALVLTACSQAHIPEGSPAANEPAAPSATVSTAEDGGGGAKRRAVDVWSGPAGEAAAKAVGELNSMIGSECLRVVSAQWEGGESVPAGVIAIDYDPSLQSPAVARADQQGPGAGVVYLRPGAEEHVDPILIGIAKAMVPSGVNWDQWGVPDKHVAMLRDYCDGL